MRVFVVESHETVKAPASFTREFKDADITPRLLEGFERVLVTSLEEMQVRQRGDIEIVAGIIVTHVEKDGIWTTGYQEHLELLKGQVMLGGYEVSFWVYGPDGAMMPVGREGLERLYATYGVALKEVPNNPEHVSGLLKRQAYLSIEEGLKLKLAKIAAMVTRHEIEKLALLQEHQMLSGL